MFSVTDLSNQRVLSSKDPKTGQEWRGRSPGQSMALIILRLQDKIVKDGKRKHVRFIKAKLFCIAAEL